MKNFLYQPKWAKTVFLTLVVGIFSLNPCKAQYFSDTSYYQVPVPPPKVILKVDLLSFFDSYSNLLIDVEHRLKPDIYLQHGIGFVTGFNNYDFDDDEFINDPIGFKLRNEIRFYLDFRKQSRKAFYLAPELLYGYVFGDEEETVGVNCDNGCDFFRLVDFRAKRQEAALHLKLGNQRIYREKLAVEYFFGVGYKYEWFSVSGLDPNESNNVRREDLYPESDFRYSLTVGLKIGWLLR